MKDFKIALCQMKVTDVKQNNIEKAAEMIRQSAAQGCMAAVLPEMFNCPYDHRYFQSFAEKVPDGETCKVLMQAARENNIYVFGGSIPEVDDSGKIYNTALAFSRQGQFLAKHRKVHLFDINLPDIKFQESAVLSAGDSISVIDTPWARIGMAICYDIRFPDFFRLLSLAGAEVIVVPAAFNRVTGPAHWEITMRMRAIDNQVYVAGVSPAANYEASYNPYGHSMVADPWGKVIARAGEEECLLTAVLEAKELYRVRNEFPLLKHRRSDIYEVRILENKAEKQE